VFPASATPGVPPSTPGGFNPAARFLADEATRQSPAAPAPALGPAATAVFGTEPIVAPTGTLPQLSEAAPRSLEETIGRRRTGWRRWAPRFLVIFFLLAGAIGMLIFLGHDMGPAALAVGLTAAIVPVPLLVASFLWLDRYEPEPVRYLAFAFAWGAAIATSVALLVNTGTAWLFDKIGLPDALVAVLVAPSSRSP